MITHKKQHGHEQTHKVPQKLQHDHKLYTEFKKITKGTVLENFRPHEIRHTTGTYIVSKTGNTKLASEFLGHSSAAFTADTYVKPISDDKRKIAESFQDEIRDALAKDGDYETDSANIESTQSSKN